MKLNLECGNFLRNGYLNVNSYSVDIHENVTKDTLFAIGNFRNIGPIVKDQKFEEIVFSQPLNVFTPPELLDALSDWRKYLTDDGVLKIQFIDIKKVCIGTNNENWSIQDAHNLIFGQSYQYKMLMDSNIFRSVAKDRGYSIVSIDMNDVYTSFELQNNVKN